MPHCRACSNSSNTKDNRKNGIFFHRFPNRHRSPERFTKWVKFCKRDFKPGSDLYICSKHFKASDLDESQLLKLKLMPNEKLKGPALKAGAVPSMAPEWVEPIQYVKVEPEEVATSSRPHHQETKPDICKIEVNETVIKTEAIEEMVICKSEIKTQEEEVCDKSVQCELGIEVYRNVQQTIQIVETLKRRRKKIKIERD